MFEIQNEITTPVKFFGKLLLTDALGALAVFNYGLPIANAAYSPLKIPSIIFIFGIYVFWIFPSKHNKRKRHYHRLFYMLTRNRHSYLSMEFYSFYQEELYDETVESEEELELYDVSKEVSAD